MPGKFQNLTTDTPIVALATGDPGGIGPELCLKAAQSPALTTICRPVLFGDPVVLNLQAESCGMTVDFDIAATPDQVDWDRPGVKLCARDQFTDAPYELGAVNAANGHAALDSASTAIKAVLDGQAAAVVAAPQNQKSIALTGVDFDGYPSFVARETGLAPEDVFLMLCFDKVKIAHCTLHASVRQSLDFITFSRVRNVIQAVHDTLIRIGEGAPKILVGGLNPHAGEDGLFGDEDQNIVAPAIDAARGAGVNVEGPIGADVMLSRTDIDAFIVMLHDQGHIPAKLLAPRRTAGLSIGSPILFSSVAHGSGHDIAGQNKGDPAAIIEAVRRLTGNSDA
jgi:4-hydroxy-L-threonine phosphate dehydrogenase PdxA